MLVKRNKNQTWSNIHIPNFKLISQKIADKSLKTKL